MFIHEGFLKQDQDQIIANGDNHGDNVGDKVDICNRILELMKRMPTITQKQLSVEVQISTRQIKRKGEILELYQVPVSEIPIIDLSDAESSRIAELAKQITICNYNDPEVDIKIYENEINTILYKAYGLSDEEISYVEETVK